jgi:hypothetical protein
MKILEILYPQNLTKNLQAGGRRFDSDYVYHLPSYNASPFLESVILRRTTGALAARTAAMSGAVEVRLVYEGRSEREQRDTR